LGLLGLAVSAAPVAAFLMLWAARVSGPSPDWACVPRLEADQKDAAPRTRSILPKAFTHLVRRAMRRSWEYIVASSLTLPDDARQRTPGMEAAWAVLLEYRELRYGALDAFVLAMVSCAGVASGLDGSGSACRGWGLVAVLLMVAQLAVMFPLRPFTTLFSFVQTAVTLALTILSALAQLVYVWSYTTDIDALWLISASGGCSFTVIGITCVRMLIDTYALLLATVRRLYLLHREQSMDASSEDKELALQWTDADDRGLGSVTRAKTPSTLVDDGSSCGDGEAKVHIRATEPHDAMMMLEVMDSMFWDASGGALGTTTVAPQEGSDILQIQ
ncbi:membrane-associated protein, putative, partial [Bodo saltans]